MHPPQNDDSLAAVWENLLLQTANGLHQGEPEKVKPRTVHEEKFPHPCRLRHGSFPPENNIHRKGKGPVFLPQKTGPF